MGVSTVVPILRHVSFQVKGLSDMGQERWGQEEGGRGGGGGSGGWGAEGGAE